MNIQLNNNRSLRAFFYLPKYDNIMLGGETEIKRRGDTKMKKMHVFIIVLCIIFSCFMTIIAIAKQVPVKSTSIS